MKDKDQFKYLVSSKTDLLWGLVVDNVGKAEIEKDYKFYPPREGHPTDYLFTPHKGRILGNYQLIYISFGKGVFFTSPNKSIQLTEGDMLLIPPYTWHSYYPDKKTGWHEYWIGMHGSNIDTCFRNCFFCNNKLIYKIGVREDIIQLFNQAIEFSIYEKSAYQQALAGIGNLILSMSIYYDQNQNITNDITINQIDRARTIMRENYLSGITPKEVARRINMSYSWFRKSFKERTNVSPAHFILLLKLQKAKNLLLNSSLSVKEISYIIGYEDPTYFTAHFKKHIGLPPLAYRDKYSSTELTSFSGRG